MIWARHGVWTTECPKSSITGESAAWLAMWAAGRRLGFPDVRAMGAREAEAMLILERESRREASRGNE